MRNLTIEVFTAADVSERLPAKHEVCPTCEGRGTHVNPNIDGNGLSAEDMEDEDFRETYMRGGYDVTCATCGGRNVVIVPDFTQWTAEQRAGYERQEAEAAADERQAAAERRAESWAAGERW
jgi:predicted methyltransferase